MLDRHQRERLRTRFRPAKVRLLFIGEAPPASGRFFYRRDSGLYRALHEVFHGVDPSITEDRFLTMFQAAGCYLIDLCPEPVDHFAKQPRLVACTNAEASLAKALVRLQPDRIVTIVRSIEPNVMAAASRTGWKGEALSLPYPGRWSHLKNTFVLALAPMIASLLPTEQDRRNSR